MITSFKNYLRRPAYESAAAVIIGLLPAGTALWLASETKSQLIGESARTLSIHPYPPGRPADTLTNWISRGKTLDFPMKPR